jgi:dihydrolipoamide dehydrogenase
VAGRSVAIVEEHLVGGECPFYACIPSKAGLVSARERHHAAKAHEVGAVAEPLDLGDSAGAYAAAADASPPPAS